MQWRGPDDAEVLARLLSDRYFQYFMKKLDVGLEKAVAASLQQGAPDRSWSAGYAAALKDLRESLKPPSSGA
jgi:hypothetical protein